MKRNKALWGCVLAAALLLTGCGKSNGSSSSSGSMSGGMNSSSASGTAAYRTGLGVLTETSDDGNSGKVELIAAAVTLDENGRLADVQFDELESVVTADGTGAVTLPTDDRTKRQKGDDYPLAAVSSLKKGWTEQADAFAKHLTGRTPEEVKAIQTDADGKATDADLLSGCTIEVDRYRDAVVEACTNAKAMGAAKGDRVSVYVEAMRDASSDTATDDRDATVTLNVKAEARTHDADAKLSSSVEEERTFTWTISADGGVTVEHSKT